ncbi:MAG: methyl-accepting chemotaxis protein [Lautropia sp.]
MAFKLPTVAMPSTAGKDLDPDTAIIDDLTEGLFEDTSVRTAGDFDPTVVGRGDAAGTNDETPVRGRRKSEGRRARDRAERVGDATPDDASARETDLAAAAAALTRKSGGAKGKQHGLEPGFSVPWLGRQPLARQVNILLSAIVIAVSLVVYFGTIEIRGSRIASLQAEVVNGAMIESQRFAKAAAVAVQGNDTAFAQVRDSSQAIAGAISLMLGGGPIQGETVDRLSEPHASVARRIERLWNDIEPDVAKVLASQGRAALTSTEAGRELANRLFVRGEQLSDTINVVRQAALSFNDRQKSNLTAILASALAAVLGFLLLGKAYYDETWRKALEAQQQRAQAERLEGDAKRINDLNQAAILRLMNELQEVADGDLTVQATVSDDITGAIADSVNYTVEELRDLVGRINRTAAAVAEASDRAQVTASGLQAASDQQSREIRSTGESVLAMAAQIKQVSLSAAQSASVARQSLSAADTGREAVQNAIAGMNGIRDQIQETAKRIKRLGESSQEIGEIIELISDITEQTNVLSLNAAIQAASAGEAGRGFTVVAEEVQRLAERSAAATRQISALVKAIQTDTHDAVAAMERSTQGVVEGARLSDEAGTALGGIGQVSRELADLIMDISRTTEDQAESAELVAQSIQRILLVTEQTSEGTQQTAGSILALSELARELKNSVSRFRVG